MFCCWCFYFLRNSKLGLFCAVYFCGQRRDGTYIRKDALECRCKNSRSARLRDVFFSEKAPSYKHHHVVKQSCLDWNIPDSNDEEDVARPGRFMSILGARRDSCI